MDKRFTDGIIIQTGIFPNRKFQGYLFYSDDDEGYTADIPDLEACSAFGDIPYEALQEVQKAKELWIEAARSEGKPVPPPKYRPIIYQAGSS